MKRRRSRNRRLVAAVLLGKPDARHWGYSIRTAANLRPGAVYMVLKTMCADGWLTTSWEDPDTVSGRPPRRYYELTALGRERLATLVDD